MRLFLAEKPSVARDLARVLGVRGRGDGFLRGDGLCVSWCVGHLVELEEPAHYDDAWRRWSFDSLPMLPEHFDLRPRKGAVDQWRVVKRLLRSKDLTEVVNACDAGREGELIFRFVYELAGCRAPVRRLWLSSLTTVAIQQGLSRLAPGEQYEALGHAARCRAQADWLVGLNATRAMTCLARQGGGDQVMSVGRVQTPTLAMVVARDRAIEAFVPQAFWQVRARFQSSVDDDEVQWAATWFAPAIKDEKKRDDREAPKAERLDALEVAEAIVKAAQGQTGTVEQSERRRVVDKPPLLYDLTSLQRRANQRYGLSAQRTLEVAQALYERHKLLTYPRTDARFLTPDQVDGLPEVVRGLRIIEPYRSRCDALLQSPIRPGKRVVDASEVGDHHAIIPTGRDAARARLEGDEKRIFDLVARRFLAALSPDALFDRTVIVVAVPPATPLPDGVGAPLRFRARGRLCVEQGWRVIDPPKKEKELSLPDLVAGTAAEVVEVKQSEGHTRPPQPYNDATLLHAMETAGRTLVDAELKRAMRHAGLGTPATRAAILQTLLNRRFIVRDKRAILSTERGRALIDALPDERLTSPMLTGEYEARLAAIADGHEQPDAFMGAVRRHVKEVVAAIASAEPPPAELTSSGESAENLPELGRCPVCDTPVRDRRAVYACDTGRSCAFVVFKTMSKRPISATMVKALLKSGRTKVVKGFKSKKGKAFSAGLVVGEDGKVGFFFPERDEGRREPTTPVGMLCPQCGQGRLIAGRAAWGCDRYRQGCAFRLSFELGPEEAVRRARR